MDDAPFLCNLGSGQPYIYVQLPIVIGVVAIGIGMKHAIIEASFPTLARDTLLLTGAGIALWISAFLALLIVSVQRLPLARVAAVYVAALAATLVVLALGAFLPPPLTLSCILIIFLALVLIDEYSWTYGRDTLLPDWRRSKESGDQGKKNP